MTAPERETAGAVRSAHVAYFLPPDWARVARRLAPALERVDRGAPHVQLLIIVPDAGAALALARAIGASARAEGARVVAATSASRAQRLLSAGGVQVVIGAPATLAPVLAGSALKLGEVDAVFFAAADELDADSPELATLLAEVPRGATRTLTALSATPGVEAILERYLHRARRVQDDVAPESGEPMSVAVRYHMVSGAPLDALPLVLDEVDAPSATILTTDPATAEAARTLLRAIGYGDDGLARVAEKEVRPNSALVVTLGVPSAAAWAATVAAKPAQVVAIIPARELGALQRLAGESVPQPFIAKAAVLRARAADARMRAELREQLAAGIPSREVLALEPLLGEYDGLEVAAAALRLLERTRATQAELVTQAESRVRTQMKDAQREAAAAAGATASGERPRPSFGARGERMDRPRGEKPRFGSREGRDEKPRSSFGPRGDKPRFGGRDEKPRGFGPRGDKPRGPRPPKPRGDR